MSINFTLNCFICLNIFDKKSKRSILFRKIVLKTSIPPETQTFSSSEIQPSKKTQALNISLVLMKPIVIGKELGFSIEGGVFAY